MFALTPYERGNQLRANPFDLFAQWERDLFANGGTALRTDIREEGKEFVLEAELPGFDKKDIRVQVEGDRLTIQANREENTDQCDAQGHYVCRERGFGSYVRRFDVSGIDTDEIRASYENGVLRLSLPKKERSQSQSRQIQLSE